MKGITEIVVSVALTAVALISVINYLFKDILRLRKSLPSRKGGQSIKGVKGASFSKQSYLQFSAFLPRAIRAEEWKPFATYLYIPEALSDVMADSQKQFGIEQQRKYQHSTFRSQIKISAGTEIVAVPRLPGCRFNPPKSTITWLENWHRIDFRIHASREIPEFSPGRFVTGEVAFYMGPLLVGSVWLRVFLLDEGEELSESHLGWATPEAAAYQKIFVSYSHKDNEIVDKLDKAYSVLGMQYLRDIHILRSGEHWNEALLKKIEEADIFQLCWSTASKNSECVTREWRHAFGLYRSLFIRPVYWENPMPQPPPELEDIHFAYLDW